MSTTKIELTLVNIGTYQAELLRSNAPTTVQKIIDMLPIKGRGMKRETRIILPTSLKIRPERPKNDFDKGDLSIDASTGAISIHLQNGTTTSPEVMFGRIVDEFIVPNTGISVGVIIKS